MNSDETNKDGQQNIPPTGGESSAPPPKHTYRILGESGLAEDEEGNLYNASDLSDPNSLPKEKPTWKNPFAKVPDNPKHPDWVANYDPRYCGPSLEDYINRMEDEYQKRQSLAESSPSQPTTVSASSDSSASMSPTELPHDDAPSEEIDEEFLTDISDEASADKWHEALSTEINQEASTSDSETKTQNHFVVHYSRRTIIFYIIGAVVLLLFFIFLIWQLIRQIIHLFEI